MLSLYQGELVCALIGIDANRVTWPMAKIRSEQETQMVLHQPAKRKNLEVKIIVFHVGIQLWTVTRYLFRVHKWSGQTNYVKHKRSPRTVHVAISGPVKT